MPPATAKHLATGTVIVHDASNKVVVEVETDRELGLIAATLTTLPARHDSFELVVFDVDDELTVAV